MRRVVIESPYAGNVTLNTLYARAALADCLKRGEAPFASHLLYTQPGVLDDAKPDERAKGIAAGHAWMQDADVVAVYADLGISEGMKKGIEAASKVNTTFANRPVIEFRTLPEFIKSERIKEVWMRNYSCISYNDLQRQLIEADAIIRIPGDRYPNLEEGVKWGFSFNFPIERKVPRYEGSPDIPITPPEVSSTAMDSLCRELATAHAKNLTLTTRLKLANDALELKREKIAKFDEICTENSGLHEQVAAQADQIQQLTDDLEVSEYSRKELYEAIQPFARTGSRLTENPPKNLVNTNLFAGTKNEASPDGAMTYWAYPAVAITVSDCRAVAKYLKKA